MNDLSDNTNHSDPSATAHANQPGISSGEKTTSSSLQALKTATIDYFCSARQKIQIYAYNLDPRILNNQSIEKTITQLIRSSRFARIEILIASERNLQGIDHCLVKLSQRYASYLSIKLIPKDFQANHFAFYLIDGRRLIYRNNAERFETEYRRLPDSQLKQRAKYFDEVFQQASPATYLRALHL